MRTLWTSGGDALLVLLLAACTIGPASSMSSAGPDPSREVQRPAPSSVAQPSAPASDRPIDTTMEPVSASHPAPDAATAMARCNIGQQIDIARVTGMGRVTSGADLAKYVPLTGREPQVKEAGAIWIITVQAELPQPGSGEVWIDPTCVVTPSDAGWFAIGPVRNLNTGTTLYPEAPPTAPELRVPPLAP